MQTEQRIINIPDFLIALKAISIENYKTLTDVANKTNITYCHLHGMKKIFLQKEWITINIEDKTHYITITEKGKQLINIFNELLKQLDIDENKILEYRQQMHKREYTKKIKEEEIKEEKEIIGEEEIEKAFDKFDKIKKEELEVKMIKKNKLTEEEVDKEKDRISIYKEKSLFSEDNKTEENDDLDEDVIEIKKEKKEEKKLDDELIEEALKEEDEDEDLENDEYN
jgi:hypothetical protein